MDAANLAEYLLQRAAGGHLPPPSPPLQPPSAGGNSPDMEPRIAKLEAHMEQVRSELTKLSSVPVDVAAMKERLSHLPTKVEMKLDVDTAIDRSGSRTQRTIAIASAAVTIAVAAMNYLPKLLGH